MNASNLLRKINKSIAKGDLDSAFQEIDSQKEYLNLGDSEEAILLQLQARYNSLKREKLSGTSEKEKLRNEENDVRFSFLMFINSVNNQDEVVEDLKEIEQRIVEKDKEVNKLKGEIDRVGITRNIFLAFVILSLLIVVWLAKGAFSRDVTGVTITQEVYLRDYKNMDFFGTRFKSQTITVDNLVFDKNTCPNFDSLSKAYSNFRPYDWNFLNTLKRHFDISTPTLNRFKVVFEERRDEVNEIFATEERIEILCSHLYWKLRYEASTKTKDVKVLIFPDRPQVAVVLMTIKANGIKNALLEVSSQENSFAKLVQDYSDYDEIELTPKDDELIVAMMINETLVFETDEGSFEFSVERISNPGEWREAFGRSEDVMSGFLKFTKK